MGDPSVPRRPRRRARRWLLLPGAVAPVLAAGLVWQSSYATFGAGTAPLSASVGTGTVELTNSVTSFGTAVTLGDVLPGSSSSYCIAVTSTGSVPAEVRLYGSGQSATKSMDRYVSLSWVAGTGGGSYGDCSGFVPSGSTSTSTLSTFASTWAGGVLPWTLSGDRAGEYRTYRLTSVVDANAPITTKGGSVVVTFVWEAQIL